MDEQNHNEIRLGQQPPQPARGLSRPVPPLVVMVVFVLLGWFVFEIFSQPYYRPDRRSVVARVKGDQRTITIALETYFLDFNCYPAWSADPARNAFGELARKDPTLVNLPTFTLAHGTPLQTLTTPAAYITSYFTDPFAKARGATFCYWNPSASAATPTSATIPGYIIWSPGPDKKYDLTLENIAQAYNPRSGRIPSDLLSSLTYDPSNGTGSGGDVYRYKQ